MYSAIKIGGKKLYEIARRGGEVERKPRAATISELELLGREGEDFSLRVTCSKGTYIRTLCHDIGQTLGCGGCMSSLRRTRAGIFSVSDAYRLEDVQAAAEQGTAETLLLPIDSLFADHPMLRFGEREEARIRNGNSIPAAVTDGVYRVYGPRGDFLALEKVEGREMKTIKSFFEV